MSETPFLHLHVRSGFSFGFGVARPEELVDAAARISMPSLALTDRDGLYGIPRFLEAADRAGILPIVGVEVSTAGGHVVLLAESIEGYRSLCRLITEYRTSSEDRRRPVCPLSTVVGHAEGVICLTGAVPFGLLPRLVLNNRSEEAVRTLRSLSKAFGRGRLYVELTDDQTANGKRNMGRVAAFARASGVPVVATGEVAYLTPADHRLHEVLVAAANLTDLPGPEYRPTDRMHLRSTKEMRRLFAGYPDALANAATVAERCAGMVALSGAVHMPQAILPPGKTAGKVLLGLTVAGARRRYRRTDGPTTEEIKARLRRELSCIEALGFAPYFLIAHEAKEIAKSKDIPVTGRGSAANSLVSYCLGLTQPEPFSNRLLFERFLHEGRRDPPDVDLDFCSVRRDEVRFEMIRRYERLGVAEAATVQTMSLRGAVRVAARALGHSPGEIDVLSRHVPTRFSGPQPGLRRPLRLGGVARGARDERPSLAGQGEVSAPARALGRARRAHKGGGHPQRGDGIRDGGASPLGAGAAGAFWEGGAPALPVRQGRPGAGGPAEAGPARPQDAHRAPQGRRSPRRGGWGREVDPYDPAAGGRGDLRPDQDREDRRDLPARVPGTDAPEPTAQAQAFRSTSWPQISLFRPGPVRGDLVTPYVLRKNGRESHTRTILPQLEEMPRPTYGVLVFQEQVLDVANAVAGFTLAEGDLLRRAMTKDRGPGAMRDLRREFLRRARENGVPAAGADEVFSWMEGFSVYGFSAAHAACFAELSYASAYMRCHYPAEFFAALLDSQPMGFYSPRLLLNEARRIGLRTLPPDIHLSDDRLHRRGEWHGPPRGPALLQGALGEVYLVHRRRAAQEAVRLGR